MVLQAGAEIFVRTPTSHLQSQFQAGKSPRFASNPFHILHIITLQIQLANIFFFRKWCCNTARQKSAWFSKVCSAAWMQNKCFRAQQKCRQSNKDWNWQIKCLRLRPRRERPVLRGLMGELAVCCSLQLLVSLSICTTPTWQDYMQCKCFLWNGKKIIFSDDFSHLSTQFF